MVVSASLSKDEHERRSVQSLLTVLYYFIYTLIPTCALLCVSSPESWTKPNTDTLQRKNNSTNIVFSCCSAPILICVSKLHLPHIVVATSAPSPSVASLVHVSMLYSLTYPPVPIRPLHHYKPNVTCY